MYGLTNKEKLSFIRKFSKELGITAYDFGENTKITAVGARNILEGVSKNPRTKNLNIMLNYIENKQLGSGLNNNSNKNTLITEPNKRYKPIINNTGVVPFYNVEISGIKSL